MQNEYTQGRPYVYTHKVGGEVIYVGCGKNARFISTADRSYEWRKIVQEAGGKFSPEIVKWFDNKEDALAFEKGEIKRLKPRGNGTGNPHYVQRRIEGGYKNVRMREEAYLVFKAYSDRYRLPLLFAMDKGAELLKEQFEQTDT